jgi:hypothetical protein
MSSSGTREDQAPRRTPTSRVPEQRDRGITDRRHRDGTLYAIGQPTWTPDGTTVLVHDSADRILLITTGTHPTTRVLADHAAILWDTTNQDLLTRP